MADFDVKKEMLRWKRALRLDDWKIAVDVVDCLKMEDGTPLCGRAWSQAHCKSAVIEIDSALSGHLLLMTLVHEMLHVRMALFSPRDSDAACIAEENAVWALENAIGELILNGGGLTDEERAMVREAGKIASFRYTDSAGKVWMARAHVPAVASERKRSEAFKMDEAASVTNTDPVSLAQIKDLAEDSTDPEIKQKAAELLALIAEHAGALGDTEVVETASDVAPGDVVAPGDTEELPPMAKDGEDDKPMTRAEMRRFMQDQQTRQALFASAERNRVGFTPQLRKSLEGMPTAMARKVVESLPLKPAAATKIGAPGAKSKPQLDGMAMARIAHVDNANGISAEKVADIQARTESGDPKKDPRVVSVAKIRELASRAKAR